MSESEGGLDTGKEDKSRGAEEEIEVWGERGKGGQMLKADKQQSVASCVSSQGPNNKTEEMREGGGGGRNE